MRLALPVLVGVGVGEADGGAVAANYSLSIANPNAGSAGVVYYTLDGSDPRVPVASTVARAQIVLTMPVVVPTSIQSPSDTGRSISRMMPETKFDTMV